MKRTQGNGNTQHNIIMQEQGPGYVIFSPDNLLDIPDQYFAHLSMKLSELLKSHPGLRVRNTLPICDTSGQTVILHVWFDRAAAQPPRQPQNRPQQNRPR